MNNKLGDQTIIFNNKPRIISNYSIVGEKEGNGNFKDYFHYILKDDLFGEKSFEHAEQKMLQFAIEHSIKNANLKTILLNKDLDDLNMNPTEVCYNLLDAVKKILG